MNKNDYPHLFSPLTINKTVLKNRIISTPMGMLDIGELEGPAYCILGSMGVDAPNSLWGPVPYAFSRHEVDKTHARVLLAHCKGMLVAPEILHCGSQGRISVGDHLYGPCDTVNDEGFKVKAMNREDMDMVINAYAKMAKDSKTLGFDMLFMHFAHGWLPAQFLSPIHNHRTDEYGGTLENRAKFPLEILKAVREAVGPDFPIDMRISAVEYVENSITFDDTLQFILWAEKYIDSVQISCGLDKGFNYSANVKMTTPIFEPRLLNVEYAAKVKSYVKKIKVGVVGGIETPEEAEKIIAENKADMVGIGRAFVADPEWAKKAYEGRSDEIKPCLRCLQCYHIATAYKNIGCSVNARFHHENLVPKEEEYSRVKNSRNVIIVGAGPAGIRAALTAYKRGNKVTLIEKESKIGGMLNYICKEHYKDDVKRYFDFLKRELAKTDITIMTNTTATKELIKKLNPDYLYVAIGSAPVSPRIPGIDKKHVHSCLDAIDHFDEMGKNVVVIGGGTIGAELALGLSEFGDRKVSLIEATGDIVPNANMLYRISIKQHFEKCKNCDIYTNTKCIEIKDHSAVIETEAGIKEIECDDVIIAIGMRPKIEEANSFFNVTMNTELIGDCHRVAQIQEATLEGVMAGLKIE